MKSLLNEIKDKFLEIDANSCNECSGMIVDNICESCGRNAIETEIEEQNVTGNIAGFNTPAAFAAPGKWKSKSVKYESAPVKKIKSEDILENQYLKLIEGYRAFATNDPTVSPEKKVKNTIKEIAKKLQEIETLVNHNSKLKTEAGVTSSTYGPSEQKALTKISERLIKISERVRTLGE
jgi:hypothetical protein